MISSALPVNAPADGVLDSARALSGIEAVEITPVGNGGNNRVFRVDTATGTFALKGYPQSPGDDRDRLGAEFGGLKFLNHNGVDCVPTAIAKDTKKGFALYQWIEGVAVTEPGETEIDTALGFVQTLAGLGEAVGAEIMPLASEASLSASELCRQLTERIERLGHVAATHSALARFLDQYLTPAKKTFEAAARKNYADAGIDFATEIESTARVLSPSDFGFHNALRTPDDEIVFLDFEYFGWDDPVKLTADFLLHPGHALNPGMAARFHQGAVRLFGDDSDFANRLAALYRLYGLRWCLIILAEFLPERMARRQLAGLHADTETARETQLNKARAQLNTLTENDGTFPYGD